MTKFIRLITQYFVFFKDHLHLVEYGNAKFPSELVQILGKLNCKNLRLRSSSAFSLSLVQLKNGKSVFLTNIIVEKWKKHFHYHYYN